MELMLRCAVDDRPGALAALAGVIGEAGGDILAVDVVESQEGVALDDLVVFIEPAQLGALVERIEATPGVRLVHAGPSRGHPGDAVTRLAIGLESVLNGATTFDRGLQTLVGGLLRASDVALVGATDLPPESDTVCVLAIDPSNDQYLILRRDYRFTPTEVARARALLSAAVAAAATPTRSV